MSGTTTWINIQKITLPPVYRASVLGFAVRVGSLGR
jgi:hypothetical protein